MTKETLKDYTDKTREIVKLILQTFLYINMSGLRILSVNYESLCKQYDAILMTV